MTRLLTAEETDLSAQIHEDVTQMVEGVKDYGLGWLWEQIVQRVRPLIPTIINGAIFLVISLVLLFFFMKFVRRWLNRSKLEKGLHYFVYTLVKYGLLLGIFLTLLGILNIPMTPIITALGAVGLALSLSVKDSLGNVAGGIALIFNSPFRTGDFIELKGISGTVEEIRLTYTVLKTTYNRRIFMPNSDFAKATVTNYSTEATRTLELVFTVKPQSGIDKAKAIIGEVIEASGMALADSTPVVRVSDHSDTAVKITCIAKVDPEMLFDMKAYVIQHVLERFQAEGM
ncbi:mechanosensitive ion channel family protein [Ruminococcaceae bacterium OttesenSCG-928-L11]|nr:mechanosensitive ion channel family protein [Ruminococcaceae bacterium OttesenSCG-928-L11]